MKADTTKLAGLFFEAGMIDETTFQSCTKPEQGGARGLLNVLKKDVSVQTLKDSVRGVKDLLTMEIDLPFGKKDASGKETGDSTLHSALSQPIYISNSDIKAILTFWKPTAASLIGLMKEAGTISEEPRTILDSLGKGGRGLQPHDRQGTARLQSPA